MNMLKEWKLCKDVFKKPKLRLFIGFWSTTRLSYYCGKILFEHRDNPNCWQYRIAKHFINYRTNPFLPVWRRGNTIRLFKNKQKYDFDKEKCESRYMWQDDFYDKLKKYHLGWLKTSYTLPIWLSIHVFRLGLMWKWKYDDVRYEFPPQFTFVLFNLSFTLWYDAPRCEGEKWDDGTMYWESVLYYGYKLEKEDYDLPLKERLIKISDSMGAWYTMKDKQKFYTWQLQPSFLKDKNVAKELKEYQNEMTKKLLEKDNNKEVE